MPRDVLSLTDFSGGTISNADAKDIPDNCASTSNNIDGDASQGKLIGIPDNIEYKSSARGYDATRSAWITRTDGTIDLVYDDGTNIKAINDWYSGFTADAGISVAYRGYSFVNRNQEVHIGCGTTNAAQWVGKISHGFLSASAPTNLYLSAAALTKNNHLNDYNFYVTQTAHSDPSYTMNFSMNYTYVYSLSVEYDYIQESPLEKNTTVTIAANTDYISLEVVAKNATANIAGFNKRITAVKVYRSEQDASQETTTLPSLSRLIRRLPTDALVQTDFTWAADGADISVTIQDDNFNTTYGNAGNTYEQESGIAENLATTDMKYTVSCEAGGYLFAGNCAKTEVAGASGMIFRSKSYRYDSFDWSKVGEFVNLRDTPIAMANFNGRVWVFSLNNIYRINPDTMTIEDTTTGIGCYSQRSLIVTDYGMFWCDAAGAYWHDGQTISKINIPITASSGAWHGYTNTGYTAGGQDGAPIVQFLQKKNYIIFAIPNAGTNVNAWGFHVLRKRWDAWSAISATCGTPMGMFTGKSGEIYIADGTSKLYNILSSSTTKTWTWTTKEFDYENVRQRKRLYGISSTKTGTVTESYIIDGGSTVDNATTPMTKMNAYRTKFIIAGTATNSSLDKFTVMFRRLHLNA